VPNSDGVIVGGGIIGLSIARHLTAAGLRVTVLDAGRTAESASAGNAGIAAPGHLPLVRPGLTRRALRWLRDPDAPLYIPPLYLPRLVPWLWRFHRSCTAAQVARCMAILGELGAISRADLLATVEREGIACSWRPAGWLDVYRTASGRDEAAADADAARREGFTVTEWSGDELRDRDPAFSAAVRGAMWHESGISLDPGALLAGLRTALAGRGVNLREEAPVAALRRRNGRCDGVVLADGEEIRAGVTVLAAGAWSAHLARSVGVRIPLAAAKGYHLDLPLPDPAPRTACVLVESFVAVTPLADRLRLAGTLEFSGLNHRLVERRLTMLLSGSAPYLKGLKRAPELSRWCGLRPCTPDGLPVVGWAPDVPGLFIATGHAKMGLTLGPGTGRLAAALISGGEPPLDASPLSPSRFAR